MINPSELNLLVLPSVALSDWKQLPCTPCIYFAIDSFGAVQYIGRSVNPRSRWARHHRRNQLDAIGNVCIAYLSVDLPELLPEIEEALIAWFKPPLNGWDAPKSLPLATQKPKLSVYLEPELLEWFQEYCKAQERSISAQVVFMIRQLKQSEESND